MSTVTTDSTTVDNTFIPDDIKFDNWSSVSTYYHELKDRSINNVDELLQWLSDYSDLETYVATESRWRYVQTTIDTRNEEAKTQFQTFVSEINPERSKVVQELDRKLIDSPFKDELSEKYKITLREIQNDVELFREENVNLAKEITLKTNQYQTITSMLSVELDGEEMNIPKANLLLKSDDRAIREKIWGLISQARMGVSKDLDSLMTELIQMRTQLANQAGFDNFRDYKFRSLGRFDYSAEDCLQFHQSIKSEIVPVLEELQEDRRKALDVDRLRPWDLDVNINGKKLQPTNSTSELVDKTLGALQMVDPYFADCLRTMDEKGYLDLESRMGKAPGGYNMGLPKHRVPFIFMNATNSDSDIRVITHEAGHAVHSFLCNDLEHLRFKSYPSEVAELASMTMELFAMKYWHVFYPNAEDRKVAMYGQLANMLGILPMVARVDSFQHWLYLNPNHTHDERAEKWLEIVKTYGTGLVDNTGFEEHQRISWQRVLHIFELPFYYIEYAIAQLGAIAMWRRYEDNPEATLKDYKKALSLGYTKSIHEIYQTAGIPFDFSKEYVSELAAFCIDKLREVR